MSVTVGVVVPVIQSRFVPTVVKLILKGGRLTDLAICIVNDGNDDVARDFAGYHFPNRVHLLNLAENRCFAGANNAGWRYLLELYPELRYLMSINDDTIPPRGFLDQLVQTLDSHPRTAVAMPVMLVGNRLFPRSYAAWRLVDTDTPMTAINKRIDSDCFSAVINGFCFLARREALEEVEFFDERYRNSCEDVDLALKLLISNWRLAICKRARVYHRGGQSRYRPGTGTDLDASHRLLMEKWGFDLTRYNNLDQNGFLAHRWEE